MKYEKFTVNAGATINCGNMEFIRRDVTAEFRTDEGEDPRKAFMRAQSDANDMLANSINDQLLVQLAEHLEYIVAGKSMKERMQRAVSKSPLFRWLKNYHPMHALAMLSLSLATHGAAHEFADTLKAAAENGERIDGDKAINQIFQGIKDALGITGDPDEDDEDTAHDFDYIPEDNEPEGDDPDYADPDAVYAVQYAEDGEAPGDDEIPFAAGFEEESAPNQGFN